MLLVPTQPLPNQQIQCQLNGQACTLNVYQQPFGLFIDVFVGATQIIAGVICENMNRIVRNSYLGFVGDFAWIDTQAPAVNLAQDPIYTGLGTRFQLLYLFPTEIPPE